MPLNGLTFAGIGTYPLDTLWSPGHPRYGECTQHMYASGDWTRGGTPTNRDGVVNYNDPNAAGPSTLGVNDDKGAGPVATYTSWDFHLDLSIVSWPTGPGAVNFLVVQGVANPPYTPGTTAAITVGFNRAGFFFTQGQLDEHSESTGVTYHGGPIGVHLEVTPKGLWWLQVSAGSSLALTACGAEWGGGELFAASWGEMSVGGSTPVIVLTSPSVSGTASTRTGPAECPHPPAGGAARARVFWVPFGE